MNLKIPNHIDSKLFVQGRILDGHSLNPPRYWQLLLYHQNDKLSENTQRNWQR